MNYAKSSYKVFGEIVFFCIFAYKVPKTAVLLLLRKPTGVRRPSIPPAKVFAFLHLTKLLSVFECVMDIRIRKYRKNIRGGYHS